MWPGGTPTESAHFQVQVDEKALRLLVHAITWFSSFTRATPLGSHPASAAPDLQTHRRAVTQRLRRVSGVWRFHSESESTEVRTGKTRLRQGRGEKYSRQMYLGIKNQDRELIFWYRGTIWWCKLIVFNSTSRGRNIDGKVNAAKFSLRDRGHLSGLRVNANKLVI